MKTADLKKMLRKTPNNPVPTDLRDRLIETIPDTLEVEQTPTRPNLIHQPFRWRLLLSQQGHPCIRKRARERLSLK